MRPPSPIRSGLLLAGLCAAALGCTAKEAPSSEAAATAAAATAAAPAATPREQSPPPTAKPKTGPDPRTASQFAAAWARLRQVPVEQQGAAGKTLRDDWHGRTYTWTGYAVPGLCQDDRHSCALHVFERRTTPAEARLDGYFPQVRFTEAGYAALKAGCKGKAGCVVTFSGRLAETATDPAEPLQLAFEDATFVAGRDPTPDEQWFGRRPDSAAIEKAPNAGIRTGKASPTAIKVRQPTF